MKKNVGGTDKTIRIIAGCVIIVLGIIFKSWWGALGLLPLLTGIFGVCLAYVPFGISTCKKETK
jgi:predicted RND superfamily exporter protein